MSQGQSVIIALCMCMMSNCECSCNMHGLHDDGDAAQQVSTALGFLPLVIDYEQGGCTVRPSRQTS